ncbi:hypothetical protein [Ferriphaselus sp. R-1]|uniref:hypothetical protein n=1 Tax=Ferriphaselus sp. R-1 TaxID=1485544 RepID=UPI00055267D4|nr:hypothetical protein [Ferriphaselus sp. R-1]
MAIGFLTRLFRRADSGWSAIGIGNGGVGVAQVEFTGGMPRVVQCGFHAIPKVNSAALEKLAGEHKLGRLPVTTLLGASEYQIMPVEAPNVPADELNSAVRWLIKDGLNFDVEAVTLDVIRIPSGHSREGQGQSYYAVAAPNETIRKRTVLLESARIPLRVIDVPEMAQRNLASLYETPGEAVMMLVADSSGTALTVSSGGELYLSRHISIGEYQLDDGNTYQRQHAWDELAREAQRSLEYFERQFELKIGKVMISLRSELYGREMLEEQLSVPVERVRLADVLDISAVARLSNPEFAASMLLLIGAALRQERRVL